MEAPITKQYLDAIGAVAEDKSNTFRTRAKCLQHELLHKDTDIHERLEWIDTRPCDLFETYLRLRVRRVPRQAK